MRKFLEWLKRQTQVRPFLSVLIVLIIIVVPGYARIENAVNKANESTKQVKTLSQTETRRNQEISFANCQTRNTATKNGRNRFDTFFTAIEVIFTSAPNQSPERIQASKDFVNNLREHVPLDAKAEDVDCNKDGKLGPEDYGT